MTNSTLTQGLGTALLFTQGFATSVYGTGGMAQGGSPQAVPTAVVGRDSFTGADGIALESHTPASGLSWIANAANAGSQAVLDGANRVRNNSISLVAYTISAAPGSANQSVQADVVFLTRNLQAYDADVSARFSTSAVTGYSSGYNSKSQLWHISRWNAGTQTALQTVSASLTPGITYTASLVVQGAVLSLYVNGALTIGPYTDSSPITATGNVGLLFRLSGGSSDTDTTGAHLANFVAECAVSAIDVVAQYAPTASGGMAEAGSAEQTVWHNLGGTGGSALGGAQSIVGSLLATASGGMAAGSHSVISKGTLIVASGGQGEGGSATGRAVHSPTVSGGSGQGGWASLCEAHLLSGAGGSAQGGDALEELACLPRAGGGITLGSSASCQTGTVSTWAGTLTQGFLTGQLLTQGYTVRQPVVYTPTGTGGLGMGGAAAVLASYNSQGAGGVVVGGSIGCAWIIYNVYMNSGQGDPINYTTPVGTVSGQSWTSGTLSVPGDYKLAVRALDPQSGIEEQNVDAVVELNLDARGNDVTNVPPAPLGTRALALAGGMIRVEWTSYATEAARRPLGFHVYLGTTPTPDYSTAVATIAWTDQRQGCFTANLSNLVDDVTYSIGVRAFNDVGEEQNTFALSIKADGDPPSQVESLEAVATNSEA